MDRVPPGKLEGLSEYGSARLGDDIFSLLFAPPEMAIWTLEISATTPLALLDTVTAYRFSYL
jgi:hypothetical protein